MQHLLARTRPSDLPSLSVARQVYQLINCSDENGLNYEDYEDYAEALEQYWTDAIVDEDGGDDDDDACPGSVPGGELGEIKYNEGRLAKARGDLLDAQQNEALCRQYLQMLAETMERPWIEGVGVQKSEDDDFEQVVFAEDGTPIRAAMRTGYVDRLSEGLAPELEKYVDVRKIWCLSEKAARIGQARRELIESVLTAHAADIKRGGKGILFDTRGPGRPGSGEISLEDVRKELDCAYEAKLQECTEALPGLVGEVAKAQKVVDDRQRDLERNRREREERLSSERAKADEEARASYDRDIEEWREECRLADMRQEEERKRREAEDEARRKAVHDAARRRCLLERYGVK